MDAIKVGNVILMKDRVISITLMGRGIKISTTVRENVIGYDSKDDAQKAFDMFYNQLNKE